MSTRPAAMAGKFYPGQANLLQEMVETLLASSNTEPAPEETFAVIAPHAGYLYSGHTAAHAFARVQGKRPRRIVLIGRSHHFRFDGAAVAARGSFETPLGTLPVDEAFAQRVVDHLGSLGDTPHGPEHGLEVELPFIQVALGEVPIVPILFGADPSDWHMEAGRTLGRLMEPQDLLVISTDLSHYHEEQAANVLDHNALHQLLTRDPKALVHAEREGKCFMCGTTAVVAGMACALERGARQWRVLDYRTSAAASGDYTKVVGYAAVSMEMAA